MKNEVRIFQLALERLMEEVDLLKEQFKDVKAEMKVLKTQQEINEPAVMIEKSANELVLLDSKEVQGILGVCYNTLQRIVEKGLLTPIRINKKRIRYSKAKILEYLRLKQVG